MTNYPLAAACQTGEILAWNPSPPMAMGTIFCRRRCLHCPLAAANGTDHTTLRLNAGPLTICALYERPPDGYTALPSADLTNRLVG